MDDEIQYKIAVQLAKKPFGLDENDIQLRFGCDRKEALAILRTAERLRQEADGATE